MRFDFNNVVTRFFNENEVLTKDEKKLLHFIECRSELNNGDTKISDKMLCKLIGKSRQTVTRYLKKLEDLRFITRLTTRYKSSINGKVYANRVIRCLRILVKCHFEVRRDLGWKKDPRPDFSPAKAIDESTGKRLNVRWLIRKGMNLVDAVLGEIKPAWEWYPDLYKMGCLSPEQQTMYDDLKEKIEIDNDHKEALNVFGRFHGGLV